MRPRSAIAGSVLVREPVLWLTGALRALNVPATKVPAGPLAAGLTGLGQVPFAPPNVGGWPAGTPWLTTASALARLNLARAVVNVGDISPVTAAPQNARVAATAALLGLPDVQPAHGRRAGPAHREPAAARRDRARLPGKLRERMNGLTRRRFLLASGAAAVAATAATVGWKDLADRTRSDPLPVGTGVLVLVTLYGGNDGLNTVVPAADPAYQSARPDLAYAQDEVLDIGEGLGLNPGLAGPQAAVGQRHAGDRPRRQLPEARPQPLPLDGHLADGLARTTPRAPGGSAAGWTRTAAIPSPPCRWSRCCRRCWRAPPPRAPRCRSAGSRCRPGRSRRRSRRSGSPSAGESPLQAYAARSITDLHRTVDTFGKDVDAKAKTPGKQGALAAQLDVVARCVEAGAPARVYSVSLGGFDTHADERGTQQRLLTEVDQAVSGFLTRMAGTDRGRGVVLMAYSEFGRRVAANANEGTDHGTAGPVFVAGAPVKGGFVGAQPSLTDLDNGDLKATTDFRDVYATMLSDVLNADPTPVLGPGRTTLPLLSGA